MWRMLAFVFEVRVVVLRRAEASSSLATLSSRCIYMYAHTSRTREHRMTYILTFTYTRWHIHTYIHTYIHIYQ